VLRVFTRTADQILETFEPDHFCNEDCTSNCHGIRLIALPWDSAAGLHIGFDGFEGFFEPIFFYAAHNSHAAEPEKSSGAKTVRRVKSTIDEGVDD
jgi:hypothetical protein